MGREKGKPRKGKLGSLLSLSPGLPQGCEGVSAAGPRAPLGCWQRLPAPCLPGLGWRQRRPLPPCSSLLPQTTVRLCVEMTPKQVRDTFTVKLSLNQVSYLCM